MLSIADEIASGSPSVITALEVPVELVDASVVKAVGNRTKINLSRAVTTIQYS